MRSDASVFNSTDDTSTSNITSDTAITLPYKVITDSLGNSIQYKYCVNQIDVQIPRYGLYPHYTGFLEIPYTVYDYEHPDFVPAYDFDIIKTQETYTGNKEIMTRSDVKSGSLKVSDTDFMVEGTPVDCVIFAVSHFGKIFDVVISGSNHGFNLSHDIMYSGTCGAVYQALMQGIPAIAFSEDRKDTAWEVKKWGKEVMDYIISNNLLSKDYFINVNFPKQEFTESKGIVLTDLFLRTTKYEIKKD